MKFFKFKVFLIFLIFFFNLKFFNFFNEEILLFFCFFTFLFFFYFYIGDIISKGIDNRIDELRVSFLRIFFELKAYIIEKENFNLNYKLVLRFQVLLKFFFFKILENQKLLYSKEVNFEFLVKNLIYKILSKFSIIKNLFTMFRSLLVLTINLKKFMEDVNMLGIPGVNKIALKKKLYFNFLINNKVTNFFFFNFFF